MPSPTKNRMKSEIGSPTADAAGVTTVELPAAPVSGSAGSPLVVAAADLIEPTGLPNSRRLKANAVHISGAAAGTSPLVPDPNHDSSPPRRPDTEELLDAGCAAVITGACAAAAAATASTTSAAGDGEESASAETVDSMVVSESASVALGGNDGVDTEPSAPRLPDPDGINEGTEGDVADSQTSDRVPRRPVFAAADSEESTSAGDADSMVVAASASVELGGNDGVETGPSVPGLPDPDGINEGTEGDVADSQTSDRVPRRPVFAAEDESDPARASLLAGLPSPTAEVSSGLKLSGAEPASEAVSEEEAEEESASEPAETLSRATLSRAPPAVLGDGDDVEAPADDEDEDSEAFAPVEPAEPVVSAKAIGIDPIAEPTPRATANAPIRPTYRA